MATSEVSAMFLFACFGMLQWLAYLFRPVASVRKKQVEGDANWFLNPKWRLFSWVEDLRFVGEPGVDMINVGMLSAAGYLVFTGTAIPASLADSPQYTAIWALYWLHAATAAWMNARYAHWDSPPSTKPHASITTAAFACEASFIAFFVLALCLDSLWPGGGDWSAQRGVAFGLWCGYWLFNVPVNLDIIRHASGMTGKGPFEQRQPVTMESLRAQMEELERQQGAKTKMELTDNTTLLPSGSRALADTGGVRHRTDTSLAF